MRMTVVVLSEKSRTAPIMFDHHDMERRSQGTRGNGDERLTSSRMGFSIQMKSTMRLGGLKSQKKRPAKGARNALPA